MAMSNFIDEAERHSELYGIFTERQKQVLSIINKIKCQTNNDNFIHQSLLESGVTEAEIGWLKRTGCYKPVFNSSSAVWHII
jgi:hypothetical protein